MELDLTARNDTSAELTAQGLRASVDLLGASDRTVVLGIGNPIMGDDGLGIHAIRDLQSTQCEMSQSSSPIEFLDGGTLGYLLIDRLMGAEGLIVVDAANLGGEAGELKTLEGKDMDIFLTSNPKSSVHEVGLIDLLQMMDLAGHTPRRRALVAVQPALIDWGTDLTPAVANSLVEVRQAVVGLLTNWYGGQLP